MQQMPGAPQGHATLGERSEMSVFCVQTEPGTQGQAVDFHAPCKCVQGTVLMSSY